MVAGRFNARVVAYHILSVAERRLIRGITRHRTRFHASRRDAFHHLERVPWLETHELRRIATLDVHGLRNKSRN
jgi:hypothetical protein